MVIKETPPWYEGAFGGDCLTWLSLIRLSSKTNLLHLLWPLLP